MTPVLGKPLLAQFHKRSGPHEAGFLNHSCTLDSLKQLLKSIDTQALPPGDFDSDGLWWDFSICDFIGFKVFGAHHERNPAP